MNPLQPAQPLVEELVSFSSVGPPLLTVSTWLTAFPSRYLLLAHKKQLQVSE